MRAPAPTARSPYGMNARTVAEAFEEFRRWPSPWIIATVLVAATTTRVALGDWSSTDAWVVLGFVAAQPFVEWVAHVFLLHWRPKEVGGVTLDFEAAIKHRLHHADPRDPALVFIPMKVLLTVLVLEIGLWWAVMPRVELTFTALTTIGVIGLVYEWTHFLVHTDHTPKTAAFRRVRRNHRLHHFRNEHYWFTITNTVADRVLGTAPDKDDVEPSPTATDLLGLGERV